MKLRPRSGFTLLELLGAITIITVIACLVVPTIVRQERETSRRRTCDNNMRLIGLALMEYEQAYKRLVSYNCPWGYGGPGYDDVGRWSGFIALLPYLDEAQFHDAFDKGTTGSIGSNKKSWGPYGSVASAALAASLGAPADSLRYPWSTQYQLNRHQVAVFRCPADPGRMQMGVARTNYAFCLGDTQVGINGGDSAVDHTHGAFQRNFNKTMANITDGAANTIALGEIATPATKSLATQGQGVTEKNAKTQGRAIYELPSRDLKGIDVLACRSLAVDGRYVGTKKNWGNIGLRNFDAIATYTGFNTINGPNGSSCTPTNDPWGEGEGIYTASSYHLGGAHVVAFDGSVKFINNAISTIDNRVGMSAQDYYSPGRQFINNEWTQTDNWTAESPFGVWGSMGTISSNDYPICSRPIDSNMNGIRPLAYIQP